MDSSPIYEEYIHPISNYDNAEDEKDGYEYSEDTDFSYCIFFGKANFRNATFENEVKFNYAIFKDTAEFSEVTFEADTFFNNCTFQKFISFENSECSNIFDFSDVAFNSLLLDKSNFPYASYLRLDGWNKDAYEDIAREHLSAKHFKTKETARIIKAHFEKQNNIIESNIYYPIEMDKYREELADYSNPFMAFFTDQNYFVTTLSKYISNYGTSWFRAGIVIIFFSFLMSFIFSFIYFCHDGGISNSNSEVSLNVKLYLQAFLLFWSAMYMLNLFSDTYIVHKLTNKYKFFKTFSFGLFVVTLCAASISFFMFYLNQNTIIFDSIFDSIVATHNYIARVMNPFGAFKSNDIFKNYEAFGTIVRLVMLTFMYQFIVAFRQNTRRK